MNNQIQKQQIMEVDQHNQQMEMTHELKLLGEEISIMDHDDQFHPFGEEQQQQHPNSVLQLANLPFLHQFRIQPTQPNLHDSTGNPGCSYGIIKCLSYFLSFCSILFVNYLFYEKFSFGT